MPCWYDVRGFVILKLAYHLTLGDLIQWCASNISRNHLEVAVGSGTVLRKCLQNPAVRSSGVVDAVDIDSDMICRARKQLGSSVRECVAMDAAQLGNAGKTYDSINMVNCVHCFADPSAVIVAAAKCLNESGEIFANVLLHPECDGWRAKVARAVNLYGQWKGILARPYTVDEACRLFDDVAGLIRVRTKVVGNCLFVVAKKSQAT